MCSEPFDLCYLQESKICPGIKGVTFHVLKLQGIEGTEEITYALWDNGNLIKKTVSISTFKDELCDNVRNSVRARMSYSPRGLNSLLLLSNTTRMIHSRLFFNH